MKITLVRLILDQGGVSEADRSAAALKTENLIYHALKKRMVNMDSHPCALGAKPGQRVFFCRFAPRGHSRLPGYTRAGGYGHFLLFVGMLYMPRFIWHKSTAIG